MMLFRPLLALIVLAALAPVAAFAADPDQRDAPHEPPPLAFGGLPRQNGAEDPELSHAFVALIEQKGALGYYLDSQGAIVIVVPTSGSSTLEVSDATALGITVSIETRDIELSEVDEIKRLVTARGWRPRRPGVREPFVMFHAEDGRVRIYSDAPVDEFQHVLDRFPGRVDYRGPIVQLRIEDIEPHWGGARMISPDHPGADCTSGFSVWNSNNKPRILTAGHCYAIGSRVNSPEGTTFGIVKDRSGYTEMGIDAELVGQSGVSMAPKIYIGGINSTSSLPVVGPAQDPLRGYPYCFSGATSGDDCGHVDTYFPDVMVFAPGAGPCPGDSGAPVYMQQPGQVRPRAIIEGGGETTNCPSQGDIAFLVTWSKITQAYPGTTIMTFNP